MTPARGAAAASQAVVHGDSTPCAAPSHVHGVEGDIAHALGATGDDQMVVTAGHLQTGLNHRLQTRPASAVDLHTGNGDGQAGVECHDPSDRRRFAVGVAVAEDDVLHRLGCESGPLEQPLQRGDAEVDGGLRFEHSAVAPDRSPNRLADQSLSHACPFVAFT